MEEAALKPVSEKICVLYYPQDGRIVHTYLLVVMPGGRELTDEDRRSKGKGFAKQLGHIIDDLRACGSRPKTLTV